MGTSVARKRCDQDKKMNEMASAPATCHTINAAPMQDDRKYLLGVGSKHLQKQKRWFLRRRGMHHLGNLFPWTSAAFHAGKTPVKHTNDRIDDFLKAYFLRKKERVQKFNTSMRMRHTLRIENCLVLCKYKDVVQTLAVLSSALSVIKAWMFFLQS